VSVPTGFITNVEAEKAILGAILLDNFAYTQAGNLHPDDLSLDSHRVIFSVMREMAQANLPVDMVTLPDELGRRRALARVGGVPYLASLTDGLPRSTNIERYVELVRDAAQRRRFVTLCQDGLQMAQDGSETTGDCFSVTMAKLLAAAAHNGNMSVSRIGDCWCEFEQRLERAGDVRDRTAVGLRTGFSRLDEFTKGFQAGEYVVIGAATGEGKTSLAVQIILANLFDGVPTMFFSQEMTRQQVLSRMVLRLCQGEVSNHELRDPRRLNPAQRALIRHIGSTVERWPLWVADASRQDIRDMTFQARVMVHREKVKLIVVDYLQLVRGHGESRYERINSVSEGLRELAKSEKVTVIAVSQLARPEDKKKRRPVLYDLKESGNIEQDAHLVLLLYRPQERDGSFTREDEIIIAKQREGGTGVIEVLFDPRVLTFSPRGRHSTEAITDEEYDRQQQRLFT
jgi:replicative DNA helicase